MSKSGHYPTGGARTAKAETCHTHGSVPNDTGPSIHLRETGGDYPLRVPMPAEAAATPLEMFLAGLPDGMLMTDAGGYIMAANPSAEQMIEYPLAELDGRHIGEIIDQLDDELLAVLNQKINENGHVILDALCRLRSGFSMPAEIVVCAGRAMPGAALCFLIRNVSERREVEERLQTADLALNSVAHGIAMTDAEGALRHVNPAFLSLLGYDNPPTVLGRNIRYFISEPSELDGVLRRLQQRYICSRPVTGRNREGQTLPLLITASPVFDQEGELRNMIFLMEDMTGRIETEKLRRQAEAQQHEMELNHASLEAVADLAYELNSPLQNLLGMAEEQDNNELQTQVNRIVEIVRQLYSRHEERVREAGSEAAQPADTAPAGGLQPCAQRTVLVVDDEDMIRRLFERLLKNAFQDLTVEQSPNGSEALELFRRNHHAVIILDVMMPEMRGETIFEKIEEICRAQQWEMPHCVFCTGFMPSTRVTEIVRDTRHFLLRKPVSRNEIVAVMEKII